MKIQILQTILSTVASVTIIDRWLAEKSKIRQWIKNIWIQVRQKRKTIKAQPEAKTIWSKEIIVIKNRIQPTEKIYIIIVY